MAHAALGLAILGLIGSAAGAQTRAPLQVTVRVHDDVGVVRGADVSVVIGLNDARVSGVTDERGGLTVALSAPNASAEYQVVVRKIGYERADRFFRAKSDTMSFDVVIHRVQELSPIVVTAEQDLKRKSYHIGEEEIANSTATLIDATDILAKLRPDMICGRNCRPMESVAAMTRAPVRKCPGLAFSQPRSCPVDNTPPSYSTNIWVNGRRIRIAVPDAMALARQHGVLAGLSIASMGVLSEIKPEHIAEMTYLDDWDTSVDKLGAQGGLFIVLKPGIDYQEGKGSFVVETEAKPATAVAPSVSPPAYRLRLLGVYDAESGDPIEGAWVIDLSTGTKARSSSTGTVSLAFLPEGGSPVRIVKEGYEDLSLAVEISPEHLAPITLVMVKQTKPPVPPR